MAKSRLALLLIFLLISLALRISTFGDPNLHPDETFYLLVGQLMHQGQLPYVDVWDRKPLGLFLIYYVFAAFPDPVLAYQIGAWISASLTAMTVNLIVRHWATPRAGIKSGLTYLLMLAPLHGFGGQAPIFYNLPIAGAALLIVRSIPALRKGTIPGPVFLAMALGGLAITIKQTALFEAAFFGIYVATVLARSPMAKNELVKIVAACALVGAFPTLLISGFYWISGNWAEYWNAMVTSTLRKPAPSLFASSVRAYILYLRSAPVVIVAILGLLLPLGKPKFDQIRFVQGWLCAAVIGFVSVPNFYEHYAIPLLVPLCVASGKFWEGRMLGFLGIAAVAATSFYWYRPWTFGHAYISKVSTNEMARHIRQNDHGNGLFVFDGPALLYTKTNNVPPSPLAFPMHFNHALESDVSHIPTNQELQRVLNGRPDTIVISLFERNNPSNQHTRAMTMSYIRQNCRFLGLDISYEILRSDLIAIYGDCRAPRQSLR